MTVKVLGIYMNIEKICILIYKFEKPKDERHEVIV